MTKRQVLSWSLGVVLLLLLGWLIFTALSNTTLSTNLRDQEVAAETQLGTLKCRKTLTGAFPFFALKCQDTSEHP